MSDPFVFNSKETIFTFMEAAPQRTPYGYFIRIKFNRYISSYIITNRQHKSQLDEILKTFGSLFYVVAKINSEGALVAVSNPGKFRK